LSAGKSLAPDQQGAVADEYHEKWIAAALLRDLADLGPMDLLPDEARGD
jgi:predicted HD phosphohydrolase